MKEIQLSSPRYPGLVALVDDEDFDRVSQFNWGVICSKRKDGPDTFYAIRCIPRSEQKRECLPSIQLMHRFLMEVEGPVDHQDGDGLNNQRSNLREATYSQNSVNRKIMRPDVSSRFRGVYWYGERSKWRAKITVNRRIISLGYFESEIDAARAYDIAAASAYGPFANFNLSQE